VVLHAPPLTASPRLPAGGTLVPYNLNEADGWQCGVAHLRAQVAAARAAGTVVRALVVINPGNPTGQVLGRATQEEMVRFCAEEGLLLVADEVYQTNVYAEGKQFFSFKRVLRELGDEFSAVRLVSLNSISKGFYGECGRRGGYMECVNFPQAVKDQLYKLASINLCPNLNGQICMALMMHPPVEGDPSFPLYAQERDAILDSLKRRARLVARAFDDLDGVSCNEVEGSMYAFPRLLLPPAAVEAAQRQGKKADFEYCMELLDATGIVTVPGPGFGQEEGTFHVRTTILPPESDMRAVTDLWAGFHKDYMKRHAA
jgi:alanine transaminase